MDPLSIPTSCVGLVANVTQLSIKIYNFVQEVRDAHADLESVTLELKSLKGVLETLSEHSANFTGGAFPSSLVKQISGILTNCGGVLQHIEKSLDKHSGGGVKNGVKWSLAGREDMDKLRSSLEAHKSALSIALEVVTLSITRDIKTDTQEIRNDTASIKDETSQILAEIARLHARLPQDDRIPNAYGFTLQKYLEELSTYAETTADLSDDECDNELDSGIHIVTSQVDTHLNYDFMVESPSRPGSSTQSSASKPTQDDPSHDRQPKLDPYSTPPESHKSSFNAIPSTLFPPSSIDRRHSISSTHPEVPLLEWDPSVRRTSLANTILARNAIDQANLSTAGIPDDTKKKNSFFGKLKAKLSDKKTLWPDSKPLRTLQGHTDRVYAVAFSSDGTLLATGSKDMKVRLWNSATGVVQRTLEGHTGSVYSISFSPDGRFAASASWDRTILIWDLATGESTILKGHANGVPAVAFSPDGQFVASASWDKTIRLWELAKGKSSILQGHTGRVSDVAFSPDGKLVASASWDKTIRLWDLAKGESSILEGHTSWVGAVAFSPDGLLLASASGDMTVRLWDPATGALLHTLRGHTFLVRAVAFSPDSQLVASASADHTVRLWDSATGTARRLLRGHEDEVYGVAFSPNGQLIASASADKTVRFWEPLPPSRRPSQS